MGFPVGYTELFLPKLLLHTLFFLGLIRKVITCLLTCMGLGDFLEPDTIYPDNTNTTQLRIPDFQSLSAVIIREMLPVVMFKDIAGPNKTDSCAVCLYEFEEDDEIRRLTNCRHIFHRRCLDRWMDCDQKTCPLCRTPFVPDELMESFNERLWAASGIPDFYGDYSAITGL